VRELERTLKIADEILRFISVATVTAKAKERPAKARRKGESAEARTPETGAAPPAE
jgi:ribosomal protein S6